MGRGGGDTIGHLPGGGHLPGWASPFAKMHQRTETTRSIEGSIMVGVEKEWRKVCENSSKLVPTYSSDALVDELPRG